MVHILTGSDSFSTDCIMPTKYSVNKPLCWVIGKSLANTFMTTKEDVIRHSIRLFVILSSWVKPSKLKSAFKLSRAVSYLP